MSRARFEQEATVKGRNEATLNVKNHEMQVRYITPQTAPRLQDCFLGHVHVKTLNWMSRHQSDPLTISIQLKFLSTTIQYLQLTLQNLQPFIGNFCPINVTE